MHIYLLLIYKEMKKKIDYKSETLTGKLKKKSKKTGNMNKIRVSAICREFMS